VTTYAAYLNNAQGVRQAVLPFLRLRYTLSAAQIGSLEIDLPTSFDASSIGRDWQIEVWRSPGTGPEYLEGNKRWLIRRVRQVFADRNSLTLMAVCPNDLLRRRIIAYDAGSAFTDKTGTADDLIKALARENMTTGITGARDVSGALTAVFEVAGDTSQGASVSVACARDNLLTTVRKLCEASITAGTYLAFDVTWTGTIFQLQTYADQLGADHRYPSGQNPVILSQQFGNLADVEVVDAYEDEITVVVAGAQGLGSARTIATATDTTRRDASPFNQCEVFHQGNTAGYSSTILADLADARLRAGRPVRTITGRVAETPGTQYGRDWGWGDRVTVQVGSMTADARLDTVTIEVAGGRETIDAGVRIDD
jgi:hypothetical protein